MDVAEINIWGSQVGAVVWDDRTGYATFEFTEQFKRQGFDLAPIFMPIADRQNIYSFPTLRQQPGSAYDTFKGLPGLLADVLPDRYGNELINLWLAQQGRPINSMNPVETLCFIGSRGMGALEFTPNRFNDSQNSFSLEVESLIKVAQQVLNSKQSFSTNINEEKERALLDIIRVGTSAGGARPKAVIAYNEKTGDVRSGQAAAPKGFEHWMIKLDGVSDVQLGATHGYGRVEMAYYKMAVDCGIEMMPSRLLVENDRAHFMTKRFDREGNNTKHHIQTWCAMQHVDFNLVTSFSYEQLFQTMRVLRLPYSQAEQMFRRMVFNVIARNCDDHTKNFAFRLKKDENWELAPAYDLCHAYRPDSQWVSQHALSINGKRKEINRNDLLKVGENIKIGHSNWTEIIDQVSHVVSNWKTYADETEVNPKLRDQIWETLKIL